MNYEAPVIVETKENPEAAVIWLHGLGADGYDFEPMVSQFDLAGLAVRFIFPHAPVMSVAIMRGACRAWFDVYSLTKMGREDDVGMQKMHRYVCGLIQEQIDQGIPSARILLAGFSQGGAMALYSGLRFNKPLAGILGLSTFLAGSATLPVERSSENQETTIFLVHGTRDRVLDFSAAEFSLEQLRELKYSVAWHSYDMGHEVCAQEIQDIADFLVQQLQK